MDSRCLMIVCLIICASSELGAVHFEFGPFKDTDTSNLKLISPASIQDNMLKLIPNFAPHISSRAVLDKPCKLWNKTRVASFNTTFNIVISRPENKTDANEGLAFLIGPDVKIPPSEFLGFLNATTDGLSTNPFVSVVIKVQRQLSNQYEGQVGLYSRSLSLKGSIVKPFMIPTETQFVTVRIEYNGPMKRMQIRVAASASSQYSPRPLRPVLFTRLDVKSFVSQYSYLGFSASTGNTTTETYSISKWSLSVDGVEDIVVRRRAASHTALVISVVSLTFSAMLLASGVLQHM